jgi:ribosomal protein S18 acetylase RimI-like enzyme
VLRDQPVLFGPVASTATVWRVLNQIDAAGLDRLRAARASVRELLWARSCSSCTPGSGSRTTATLHEPATRRWIAVAEADGAIAGLVAWNIAGRRDHGRIYRLAVSQPYRRGQVGRQLCLQALEVMKADGVEVVELGTGEDTVHTAARALYESLGFTKVPIAGYIKRI